MDRDQQFLLPPDMRSWLPVDHPVWLVIGAVAQLDTSACHRRRRTGGVGRAGFDPDMLLTLLMWAWAQGMFSSRRIERACQQDIAFRIICAGDVPDHVTISRFRAEVADLAEELFAQVLLLCRRLGMGQLGVVALDGTKIGCDASISANRTQEGLLKAAGAEADKATAAAAAKAAAEAHAATDAAEDGLFGAGGRTDQVPPDAADPRSRQGRIAQALADLRAEQDTEIAAAKAKAKAYLAARQAADEQRLPRHAGSPPARAELQIAQTRLAEFVAEQTAARADYQARLEVAFRAGKRGLRGSPPIPITEMYHYRMHVERVAKAQARQDKRDAKAKADNPVRNTTDPQSRPMVLRGGGWVQGYNAQALTSADGLIIATSVSNNPSDAIPYRAMVAAGEKVAVLLAGHGPAGQAPRPPVPPKVVLHKGNTLIGLVLADAGYISAGNVTAPGPDRLIAVGKHRALEHAARDNPADGPPPADADPVAKMAHRLRTQEGIAQYRQRGHIAETPFGHTKHNIGFRRITGRGLTRAEGEWTFNAAVLNLFKAITTGHLTTATLAITAG